MILEQTDPAVESLHYYLGEIPVDLNLMTLEQIRDLDDKDSFLFTAMINGRVKHDPTGQVTHTLEELRQKSYSFPSNKLSEHTIATTRHGHKHVFDKVRGRLETMPLFCRFLLSTDIYWLVETYFRIRNIAYEGEINAIEYLIKNEPEIAKMLDEFFLTHDLERQIEITQDISERVLDPIGGMWRIDDVLTFGDEDSKNLQKRGYEVFQKLFK